jgi:hypothetical protein
MDPRPAKWREPPQRRQQRRERSEGGLRRRRRAAAAHTLTVRLRTGAPRVRVGSKPFGLRPGRTGRVGMPLTASCRRALRARWRLRGVLYAAVRDAQGVARTKTAPVRVERRRVERRRVERRRARR